MKTLNLIQGSPEWHAHRATARNASDAPALMGKSPYKNRAELLTEMTTGIRPEPDAATQKRFDKGHEVEPLLRAYAERSIGDEFYPIIGTTDDGYLSASFDGVNLDETVIAECKQSNKEKLASIVDYGVLPEADYWQVVQQFAVCDTAETCIYVCGDGTEDGTAHLVVQRTMLTAEIAKLRAAWEQFDADVASYQPTEAAPVVTATPQEHLPAVSVQVSGALAIQSNLDVFGIALREYVANIPAKPTTDQEFADTDAACKRLKEVEERLTAAEDSALGSMVDVDALRRTVAELRDIARTARLSSEKIVAKRKEEIRAEVVTNGQNALREHIAKLNERLGKPYMPIVPADFGGVIKGKKNLDSIRDAVDTELARAKIEANQIADRIQTNLKTLNKLAAGNELLFADLGQIVIKSVDDFTALVKSRLFEHERAEETKRQAETERQQRAAEAAAQKIEQDRKVPEATAPAESSTVTPLRPVQTGQTDDDLRAEITSRIAGMNRQQLNLVLMFCKEKLAA